MKETLINPTPAEELREVERALWRPFLLCALPIMLAGGSAMGLGFHLLRQAKDSGGWAFVGGGAIFFLIGAAFTGLLIFGRHKLRRGDFDAQDSQPGPPQPWRAREDWARGEVQGETRSGFVSALVGAIFTSLIAGIAVLTTWPRKGLQQWADWLMLLFPLAALYMVAQTVALGWRWLKYGDSVLRLPVIPLQPGGSLEGVIEVPRQLQPQEGLTLRLICVKAVTSGTGSNRSTREEKLWQAGNTVAADRLEPSANGLRIPVAFRLAADAPPSSKAGLTEVFWRLEVRARRPGRGYAEDFVLPVFNPRPPPG